MQSPPKLFDTHALALHRARTDQSAPDAWFIHDRAIDLISEKLKDVNKTFTKIAIVGWRAKAWRDALELTADLFPDDDDLGLGEQTYDLIIHTMSLHWANDPVGQLIQMRRALQPDGMMITAMFGGETLTELRAACAQAEARILGGITPRIAPMGEIRDLGALLQRAGYTLPVADNDVFTVNYNSLLNLISDLRNMAETNALVNRHKTFLRRDILDAMIDSYPKTDERINATFELIFLTGWAPSDTQQKPLRPGSAKMRLADALGVREQDPEND